MSFSVIAAIDANRCIGMNNQLPWPPVKADFRHFANITRGNLEEDQWNAVIMGRKTWESLPEKSRPLSNRINVVITKNERIADHANAVFQVSDLDASLALLKSDAVTKALPFPLRDIFVIGGATVFGVAVGHPECERIILTEIQYTADHCDTYFPTLPEAFHEVNREHQREGDLEFDFVVYARKY